MSVRLSLLSLALLLPFPAVDARAISHHERPLSQFHELLYGVAYYHEYMPSDRLDEDVRLMKECGINMVRICESTWGKLEPQDGEFDFAWVDEILDAMHAADIKVIVGTPTYAIPTWMARQHPEVLATTRFGKNRYGPRQNMDISHPTYRFYAARIIRRLISHVKDHPAVIGYQLDNESKHYGTAGHNVQVAFQNHLKEKFGDPQKMNRAYGLHYWSNSVNSWEDLPTVDPVVWGNGTINGSLAAEFAGFQRSLVTEFLAWQASIVRELRRPEQFIMQNFDLEWRNGSYGWQPDVDQFEAAECLDIAGIDIYHPTQDRLDGNQIAFGGDVARSLRRDNYLVVETQAQSILNSRFQRPPYPGQLRLQAYSHLASGANMVAYWPWHSIHNSVETYWKGLLSHDLEPNPVFNEARQIATEWKILGSKLVNLKKDNRVAILVSNESLTALELFEFSDQMKYNDVLHQLYDALYFLNVECDFIDPESEHLEGYDLVVVPPLYVATDAFLERLARFAFNGGHLLLTFKTGFTNEHVQVRQTRMPGVLREACGFSYQMFTVIDELALKENPFCLEPENNYVSVWAELIMPEAARVIGHYEHPHWGQYAAITDRDYGKGRVLYLGTWPSEPLLRKLMSDAVRTAGLWTPDQEIEFPVVVRSGRNDSGHTIRYYFNYSGDAVEAPYYHQKGFDLFSGEAVHQGDLLTIPPWDLAIVEER